MHEPDNKLHYRTRGYLPHLERERAIYFVTFRLADSLPRHVLEGIADRKQVLQAAKALGRDLLPTESVSLARFSTKAIEAYLDAGSGECILADPKAARIVADALEFWDEKRYGLFAWCVMPNHVHVVLRPGVGQSLSEIVGGWKSFTTRVINSSFQRQGTLWQREYYDRLLRDCAEFGRAVNYVADNPARAGLGDWRWCRVYEREP